MDDTTLLTAAGPDGDLAGALSACARANAAAHYLQWDVLLPTDATPEARIEWPSGADASRPLPTVAIQADGNWVRVHSSRRPLDEARRLVAQELGDRTPEVVCVVGAGLGYVVDALFERWPEVKVLVLEPEPALVPWLLARRDWRAAITAGRLLVVPGPGFEQRMSAWRMLTPLPTSIPVLSNKVITEARAGAAAEARSAATWMFKGALGSEYARDRFAGTMLLNTLRNLPVLAREAPITALAGLFAGRPAVLVAAGPSLNRNIEELRPHRDRVVLVSVGTAMKPLIAAGLPPDVVLAVDPGEYTYGQFRDVAAPPRTWLASELSVDPNVFPHFRGRTFAFRVGNTDPWPWLLAQGIDAGVLRSWASVLTSTLHVAVLLGCDPLVFVGADLAYTLGQTHAQGTQVDNWIQTQLQRGAPSVTQAWVNLQSVNAFETRGLDGTPVRTSPVMQQVRDWLRHESCVLPRRFVNATGAGTLMGGRIAVADIGAALEGTPDGPVPTRLLARAHERATRESRRHLVAAVEGLRSGSSLPTTWLDLCSEADLRAALGGQWS